ncbi:polysaccharide deacetylase family protein [Thermomicrobiaceae bacterium CFH 74404]|uniref:Polysaccharide deacetylase family protein n=1 Tax=Thermalbibacter longus TaxID=2951981 RepID=A0AA41WAM3_9BACT|nr:polysaccharide deacetylase family protein [Thermalbibacter longus]MCM8747802.1 polysaccharide deacetylase family protein [Thermalbibacter longus]
MSRAAYLSPGSLVGLTVLCLLANLFGPAGSVVAAPGDVTTIRRFETAEPVIVLTFDAGADRGFASNILDTLAAKGVRASFGLTGAWAAANPDLVQRMAREGHHLINHTWSHRSFTGRSTGSAPLSTAERTEELRRTEELIRQLTGIELRPYFRPPYGDFDDSVLSDLADSGYTLNMMWTIDSLGWRGLTADEITQRVLDAAEPGAIVLMHVGSQSQDAAALPALIDQLRARGYRFATVRDLVEGRAGPEFRYFPETGHWVSHGFLRYWERFGGLAIYGYPLTEEYVDPATGRVTQWFERARFEWHPGAWPARYDVLLGRLGAEVSAEREGIGPFRSAQPVTGCTYFPQTGHNLCGGFRAYWEQFGGLAVFGYPISEEFREVNPDDGREYTVQYFERQRFEWHPGAWPERYDVLLGRLGAQLLTGQR